MLKARIIRHFFVVYLLIMKFMDGAHYFCQGLIHWMGGIDHAAVIFKVLVTRLPAFPFFPRGDLKAGNLPFASLQAAFLHFGRALAVDNQHFRVISTGYFEAVIVSSAIGEGRIYHDT